MKKNWEEKHSHMAKKEEETVLTIGEKNRKN